MKEMYEVEVAYFSHLACLSIDLIFKENYNWIIFT